MNTKTITGALSGLLFMAGMATSAQAVIEITAGGASAATPFATEVPLNLCDTHNGANDPDKPLLFKNGTLASAPNVTGQSGNITTGKILIWKCKRAGVDVIMRYSATGSGDGISKLTAASGSDASKMNFFRIWTNNDDVAGGTMITTGCGPANEITRPSDGKKYIERSGCVGDGAGSPPVAVALPINVGWADTHGSSFSQIGPPSVIINPLDQSPLISQQVAIVPFAMVIGNGVVRVDPNDPTKSAGPVLSFDQQQIREMFTDGVEDWRNMGLGVVAPCTGLDTPHAGCGRVNQNPAGAADIDPGDGHIRNSKPPAGAPLLTDAASNKLLLCMRRANSGTKAAFEATVMTPFEESPNGTTTLTTTTPPSGNYFGTSNQDIRDCIGGNSGTSPARVAHPNAVGYMESDQADQLARNLAPVTGALVPGGYIVAINGRLSHNRAYEPGEDNTLTTAQKKNRKNDLLCGWFPYWVGERFNTRNPSSTDPDTAALIDAYRTSAADAATIAIVPAGDFWAAPGDMNVFKNDDKGPHLPNVIPPATNPPFACKNPISN